MFSTNRTIIYLQKRNEDNYLDSVKTITQKESLLLIASLERKRYGLRFRFN